VTAARARFRPTWVDGAGLACAALYLGLASLARGPGDPGVASFLLISAAAAVLTFAVYAWSAKEPDRVSVGRLLLWAVVFRAIGLFGGPFFEDDYFRYLWDGYRFAQDGTPYGLAPEAFFADPAVPALFQGILDRINFPELPPIYGPPTQLAFLPGYRVAPGIVAALPVGFIHRRISNNRTAIMIRYDFMDLPCAKPAASMIAYSAGFWSAISPCHASSTSLSVQVSLKAAPAASDPIGAA